MRSPSPLAGEGQLSRSDSRERGRRLSRLRNHAKSVRSEATDAERRLWQILRAKRFQGYKFRRRVPIDFYIADFVCFGPRVIIEVDDGQHAGSTSDARRDTYLQQPGFCVPRIWKNDIFENAEGVAEAILIALRSPPLPNPSPARGEGLNGVTNG
jgi:very-short-patch-repair endonuclease